MRFSHFFIDRPIFAAVLSIVITLIGGIAYFALPVAQYPEVAPPTVVVIGQLSGRHGRRSWPTPSPRRSSSRSTASRTCSTCRRSRPTTATARSPSPSSSAPTSTWRRCWCRTASPSPSRSCPRRCSRIGVTTKKNSPDLLMVDPSHLAGRVATTSSTSRNYATLQVKDELARLDGVGDVQVFGARDYSDARLARPGAGWPRCDLTAGDVVNAAAQRRTSRSPRARSDQPPVPEPGRLPAHRRDAGPAHDARAVRRTSSSRPTPSGRVTRAARRGAGRARAPRTT